MLFVVIGHDSPQAKDLRPVHRGEHLAALSKLLNQQKLRLAGPFTDKTGSLIILDVASQEEAERIAQADPYVVHGIFERVEVKPFKQVFPE